MEKVINTREQLNSVESKLSNISGLMLQNYGCILSLEDVRSEDEVKSNFAKSYYALLEQKKNLLSKLSIRA
ncbi:MAG: hypothetical protein SO292_04510 [Bacilli bacterium]|nr:hypothetical protein [Bacilli bacterium]MCI7622195.1 hypothetical protein [Bacilli bacterium]MDD7375193.1 hypothetical protein [Bacilli bacterium]MDD7598382.1 hypothetical protein [Bacilli bacterium]MDY4155576.1 hypothetical protein [Bacilli bacterium]